MRVGRTALKHPVFGPDLSNGEFARSGTRGPLRFVSSGTSIGFYSMRPKMRARNLPRGLIIKVDDSSTAYLATQLTRRETKESSDKKTRRYGPLLPFAANPTTSGVHSVSADTETATSVSRAEAE